MTAPLPSALAPHDEHGGIPERRPGGGGSSPDPPVITYPSEKALAQLHSLCGLHVEHLPQLGFGSASPPCQKRQPLGPGPRRRVRAADLVSGPPCLRILAADSGPALAAAPAPSPRAPLLLFSLRTRARRARPRPRPQRRAPPPALARAAVDGPLRAVALRPPASRPPPPRAPRRCPLRVSARARRALAANPRRAPSRKRGSARAPVPALQSRKGTASGCLGGVAGAVPGNNSLSSGIGKVSSAVERYAPPSHPSPASGPRLGTPTCVGAGGTRAGLRVGGTTPGSPRDCRGSSRRGS